MLQPAVVFPAYANLYLIFKYVQEFFLKTWVGRNLGLILLRQLKGHISDFTFDFWLSLSTQRRRQGITGRDGLHPQQVPRVHPGARQQQRRRKDERPRPEPTARPQVRGGDQAQPHPEPGGRGGGGQAGKVSTSAYSAN